MKLLWHEIAQAEYDETVAYYLDHAGPAIARNFTTALSHALRLLRDHPAIGTETYDRARRIPLHGFPFNLVYRLQADHIVCDRHRQSEPPPRVLGWAAPSQRAVSRHDQFDPAG